MATVPTPDEHRKLWAAMDFSQRRAILKAVGRGRAMDNRRDARVAVGTARQQQRYWRLAWLWGLVPVFVVFDRGIGAVVLYAVLGLMMMGTMSWWRIGKAKEAEAANLELLTSKGKKRKKR